MAQIPLSLDPNGGSNPGAGAGPGPRPAPKGSPVMGWFAVAFGLLGVFTIGFVFVPLGLICSVLALFMGQAVWGFLGLMLAVAGFLTSPKLWLIIGMGWFYHWFDTNELLKPLLDFIHSIMGDGGTRQA